MNETIEKTIFDMDVARAQMIIGKISEKEYQNILLKKADKALSTLESWVDTIDTSKIPEDIQEKLARELSSWINRVENRMEGKDED